MPSFTLTESQQQALLAAARGAQARTVLLVGNGGNSAGGWITPCGGCRQKLREFGAPDLPVICANEHAMGPSRTLAQLLPESFGPGHLKPG